MVYPPDAGRLQKNRREQSNSRPGLGSCKKRLVMQHGTRLIRPSQINHFATVRIHRESVKVCLGGIADESPIGPTRPPALLFPGRNGPRDALAAAVAAALRRGEPGG